eukprot:6108605-Ditylum_brightwellii.AAC.2
MGNLAGVLLVVFSAWISSSGQDAQIWGRDWKFYLGVAAPCVLGLHSQKECEFPKVTGRNAS